MNGFRGRLVLPSILVIAAALAAAPLLAAGGDAQAAAVEKAKASATAWLALTDAGKYAASWDQAAAAFQAAITKADWEKALTSARKPLGAMKQRAPKTSQYSKTLPGAPDGEYVVMQFDTTLEAKAAAVETVTASKEKDGTWKVAGYFIR